MCARALIPLGGALSALLWGGVARGSEGALALGKAAYSSGELAQAAAHLARAHAGAGTVEARAEAAVYLGLVSLSRGAPERARRYFAEAVRANPDVRLRGALVGPAVLAELEAIRAGLVGELRVECAERGARVWIDGVDRGPAPIRLRRLAGRARVEVASPRRGAARMLGEVKPGVTTVLVARFASASPGNEASPAGAHRRPSPPASAAPGMVPVVRHAARAQDRVWALALAVGANLAWVTGRLDQDGGSAVTRRFAVAPAHLAAEVWRSLSPRTALGLRFRLQLQPGVTSGALGGARWTHALDARWRLFGEVVGGYAAVRHEVDGAPRFGGAVTVTHTEPALQGGGGLLFALGSGLELGCRIGAGLLVPSLSGLLDLELTVGLRL